MQVELFIIVIFCLAAGVDSSGIEDKVTQYFKSDIFKAFQKHWRAHRKSLENAIVLTLKESYGNRGMNIYVRRSADALKIFTGLYGSDNVIDRLLLDPTLTSLPNLITPEVTFALASNFLRVEAGLSKMILEASYALIRNQSDIVYSAENQKLHKSPFSYVQVQPYGQLAGRLEPEKGHRLLFIPGQFPRDRMLHFTHLPFNPAAKELQIDVIFCMDIVEDLDSDIGYFHPGKFKSSCSCRLSRGHQLVSIIAEDCTIDGYVVTKLSGMSINLGHDTFRVRNCKFSIEISSSRRQPPIVAPYFTVKQSKQLEFLLTRPIRAEMLPKLQAAVFTYINTSLVFGDYLPKFRDYQNNMFKETLKYIKDIAVAIDNKTIEENQATVDAPPIRLTWNNKCPEEFCSGEVVVDNVSVHGLDTLYSAHTGGPVKMLTARIAESLRFNSLMVRGSCNENDFVAEIHDVAVDSEIDVEKSEARFEVVSWRSFELSIRVFELKGQQRKDQKARTAFIHGYLLNILPILLNNHLTKTYKLLSNSNLSVEVVTNICDCGNQTKNKIDS